MNDDPVWQATVPIAFEFDTWGNYRVYIDGELRSWLYGLGCELESLMACCQMGRIDEELPTIFEDPRRSS